MIGERQEVVSIKRSPKFVFADVLSSYAFRYYAIKPYIPRVCFNFLDFLAVKSNADQFGVQPVLPVSQK